MTVQSDDCDDQEEDKRRACNGKAGLVEASRSRETPDRENRFVADGAGRGGGSVASRSRRESLQTKRIFA